MGQIMHSILSPRQCEKKRKHLTFKSAQSHINDTHGYYNHMFNVYICSGCGFYHVGHISAPKKNVPNNNPL